MERNRVRNALSEVIEEMRSRFPHVNVWYAKFDLQTRVRIHFETNHGRAYDADVIFHHDLGKASCSLEYDRRRLYEAAAGKGNATLSDAFDGCDKKDGDLTELGGIEFLIRMTGRISIDADRYDDFVRQKLNSLVPLLVATVH